MEKGKPEERGKGKENPRKAEKKAQENTLHFTSSSSINKAVTLESSSLSGTISSAPTFFSSSSPSFTSSPITSSTPSSSSFSIFLSTSSPPSPSSILSSTSSSSSFTSSSSTSPPPSSTLSSTSSSSSFSSFIPSSSNSFTLPFSSISSSTSFPSTSPSNSYSTSTSLSSSQDRTFPKSRQARSRVDHRASLLELHDHDNYTSVQLDTSKFNLVGIKVDLQDTNQSNVDPELDSVGEDDSRKDEDDLKGKEVANDDLRGKESEDDDNHETPTIDANTPDRSAEPDDHTFNTTLYLDHQQPTGQDMKDTYTKTKSLLPPSPDLKAHHPLGDVGLSTSNFDLPASTEDDNEDQGPNLDLQELNITWPLRRTAEVEGDVVLGGLMMVHEREDSRICGPVMPQGGIQALEMMLFTLDDINNRDLLPGFTLGASILDDCDKDSYGLEQAVDFIKGSISNIQGGEYRCRDGSAPEVRQEVVAGVVGAASSVTSIQVANLLRLFKIPQVSYFSTSPELSNKGRFEYFSRTIPSDQHQVRAMVGLVESLGWSYISIVYEESNYGIKAYEELEVLLAASHVCIAVKEKLVKDSGVADELAYDTIVQRLLSKQRARGVIVFGSDQEVAGVMRAVSRNNATGTFTWIGSDGWSARSLVSSGNEAEVEGTLSVQPQANPVRGFDKYFLDLTVENNDRNPWFVEYWEHHFNCRHPSGPRTPYNLHYPHACTGKERLSPDDTQFEAQLQFVSDAVMAFGYACRDMHRVLCGGRRGLCSAMVPVDGEQLLYYLRKVDFVGLSGDKFKFDEQGDGPARYNIIHFKQVQQGQYEWVRVGQYVEGELHLNMSALQFHQGTSTPPASVCSLPCSSGQARQYVEGESCCWHCYNCSTYQVVNSEDSTQCVTCDWGTLPDQSHTTCTPIPEVYIRPDSWWAIGAMLFSSLGVVLTGLVVWVFFSHNSTPVVRASGRELSYVLLSGIFLCYATTFVFVLKPSAFVCGVQRFGLGFSFAVVYSALLTKTNRISRIFNAGKRTTKRPSFISPRSQLCICTGAVSVQILITVVWCVVSPPKAIHHYILREDNFLVCAASINASYMIAFAYPIGLITVCTVYAILTRKIPEAFNESKHIGFTMYTTCIIWLAFVPIYFSTANNVELRITTTSVTISLSATVALACLFTPKLYILMLHPERNVRQSMMPPQKYCSGGGIKGSVVSATMQRVDSCTQSEVIFPIDFELHEKLRVRSLQARNTSCTQTCSPSACCLPDHTCSPSLTLLPSLTRPPPRPPANGSLQDVPDIQL